MKLTYFYLICTLTIIDIILLAVSFRNREKKAVKSFIMVDLLIIIAHVFYGASLLITQPDIKFFVHELKFIGVALLSACFFVMYMNFVDMHRFTGKKHILLLMIVPVISVMLAITNNYHHLFRTQLYIVENQYGSFVGVQSGPLFWVYLIYSYTLYVSGMVIILKSFLKIPRIYRIQIGIMVFAAASTLIINFISISGIFFEDFGDMTLISFTIAAFIQFYGLVLYKPTGMIRMARSLAVNEIKNPIIIFDRDDKFLDANIAACNIFNFDGNETTGSFLKDKLCLPEGAPLNSPAGFEFKLGDNWYTVKQKKTTDKDSSYTVSVILLNNITEIKRRELELESIANYDYLTGISNRHAYLSALSKIHDSHLPVSIIHFNIRGMKSLNSRHGYEAGDSVIKKVADVLAAEAGGSGFCARLGGDEFALLLKNTPEPEARKKIQKICEQLPDIVLVHGLAVKQTHMDNINIIDRFSTDNMYMNRILAHSGSIWQRG